MEPGDRALLRSALLGLRDPLSRIALAASGAPRCASPEEGVRHLELIQQALAEIDARIDEIASALAQKGAAPLEPSADCRTAFALACRRASVAARARGVELEVVAPEEPIAGDASGVRRAALRILRAACDWAGDQGRVRIELTHGGEAPGLRCSGARAGAAVARSAALRDLLTRFALAEGARVEGLDSFASDALALELALPSARRAA
jgi:signal transduction histidine kinase